MWYFSSQSPRRKFRRAAHATFPVSFRLPRGQRSQEFLFILLDIPHISLSLSVYE